jgi:FkbM family methyltransferase
VTRFTQAIRLRVLGLALRVLCPVKPRSDLQKLGSEQCGWIVPLDRIREGAIAYCAGAGEDITFDLELAKRGCAVFTIDPTPRAVAHVNATAATVTNLRLIPVGLWSSDTTLRFYAPRDPKHVSHSVVNLQRTSDYFEARCMSLGSLMESLGHTYVDILKMDIEGAEFEVLETILADPGRVGVICVEFDQPAPVLSIRRMIDRLARADFVLTAIDHFNFTLVNNRART